MTPNQSTVSPEDDSQYAVGRSGLDSFIVRKTILLHVLHVLTTMTNHNLSYDIRGDLQRAKAKKKNAIKSL